MAGVGFQLLGYPGTIDPATRDGRCWFPVGVPWFTTGTREPVLALDFDAAYLLGFAVRAVSFEYDITVTPGGNIAGSGSLSPMRIDLITSPPNEQWLPFCTLFSSIIIDPNFLVAGWGSDSYDPVTKLFYGTVFLETLSGLSTASAVGPATSIAGDAFGFSFTVYASPGVSATGFFTLAIEEYWEYQLADGTICRDALTGELKQDTPPPGL